MWNQKLCLGDNDQFGLPFEDRLKAIRNAGFDEVFLYDDRSGDLKDRIRLAQKLCLPVQSVHAPFGGCADLWDTDEEKARHAENDILNTIRICGETNVPIVVSHVYIGFDGRSLPKDRGLERYGRLIEEATRCGVKLAFENTEGEEYLEAVLRTFGKDAAVGFCLDTGHEICYNHAKDLLEPYGKHLIATHLNDNLGIRDFNGTITWLDDLHLLPFDGIVDWHGLAARLYRENYTGTLTFELNTKSKPGRHENDLYEAMSVDVFLAESYKRACRFAAILKNIGLQSAE